MNRHYSRLYRQFRSLSKQINSAIANGDWQKLSTEIQRKLTDKLRSKFEVLKGIFAGKKLVRLMGAAAFLLGFNSAIGQTTFKAPVVNPFGLDSLGDLNVPYLVDIDGDGDLDIFAGDYFRNLNYFENTGSSANPAFGTPDTAAFGMPEFSYFLNPQFADFDGDGDYDLIGASDTGATPAFIYVENIGTATAPAFGTITLNPFGLNTSLSGDYLIPVVADLDGDGDFDILAASDYGQKIYYENTGSASSPSFGSGVANPFGLVNNPSGYEAPFAIGDVDKDGDLDVMEMEYYYGDFVYYENTGTSSMPAFANPVTNPFSLVGSGAEDFNVPAFGDLDGDGDLDILAGDYYGAFKYYENSSPVGLDERASAELIEVFPTVTSEVVNVKLPDEGRYQLRILNQLGVLIKEQNIQSSNLHLIQLTGSAGIYYLQFTDESGSQSTLRVVKN